MSYGQSYDHLLKITAGDNPAHNLQLKAPIKADEVFNRGAAITSIPMATGLPATKPIPPASFVWQRMVVQIST